jgi:hypothetical protein
MAGLAQYAAGSHLPLHPGRLKATSVPLYLLQNKWPPPQEVSTETEVQKFVSCLFGGILQSSSQLSFLK